MTCKKIFRNFSFISLIFLISLTSCSKKKNIVFSPDDEQALQLDLEWAVVSVPYAPFYEQHDYNSKVLAASRQGEIFEVKGKFLVANPEGVNAVQAWYCFDQGWLDGTCVNIYDNKLKAKTAAARFESSQ